MEPATFTFADAARPTYAPTPGRTDRVSLVWWDSGPDDQNPLFCGDPAAPATLAAVWPTDERGYLLADGIDAVAVRWWTMTHETFEALANLHARWPLGRHDVLVAGTVLRPCPESLHRLARDRRPDLAAAVDIAVARLRAAPPASSKASDATGSTVSEDLGQR